MLFKRKLIQPWKVIDKLLIKWWLKLMHKLSLKPWLKSGSLKFCLNLKPWLVYDFLQINHILYH